MSSPKRKRTAKFIDKKSASVRNLKQEINFCEKKLEKLLDRYNKGVKRTTKNKKTTSLVQGIKPEGQRHQNLKSYIGRLKTQLSQVSSVPLVVKTIEAKAKGKKK